MKRADAGAGASGGGRGVVERGQIRSRGAAYLCTAALFHAAAAVAISALAGSEQLGKYQHLFWGLCAWSVLLLLCTAALELGSQGRTRAHVTNALCALGRIACVTLAKPAAGWRVALMCEAVLLPVVESVLLGRDHMWRASRAVVVPTAR